MPSLWSAVQRGYLRVIAPVADWLVARRVRPNTITTIGTICTCTAGVIFATGHISAGGWFLGLIFYATHPVHASQPMVMVTLAALIATFLTSYTRARAEGLGVDAKVGMLQRAERITLLSAPQAFFGLALNGWILAGIVSLLAVTAWITVFQRINFVYRTTTSPGE